MSTLMPDPVVFYPLFRVREQGTEPKPAVTHFIMSVKTELQESYWQELVNS